MQQRRDAYKRVRLEPTDEERELVKLYAKLNMPEEQICKFVINPVTEKPVSLPTLRKHFRDELAESRQSMEYKIMDVLYQRCLDMADPDNLKAIIFMLTHKFGWTKAEASSVATGFQEALKGVLVVPEVKAPQEWNLEQQNRNKLIQANQEN